MITPEKEFEDTRERLEVAREPRLGHMDNFLDCVRTRKKPTLDAEAAYRVMVAIALGVESYRREKVMRFDPEKQRTM